MNKNIKIIKLKSEKIEFNENNKEFQHILKLANDIYPDAFSILPKNPQYKVSFEFFGYVEFANAIRRILMSEIPIYSLGYKATKNNFITDDMYQLQDKMEKQLELIPINQELFDNLDEKELDSWNIELTKHNNSLNISDITSNDLKFQNHKKEELDINDVCSSAYIILDRIRPMKKITIKNIKIVKGYGKDNAGAFNSCANIKYKILDQTPLDESTGNGESSLKSDPRHFYIEYKTHRNTKEPLRNIKLVFQEIILRLSNILKEMENITDKHREYFSELIDVKKNNEIINIYIKGEYWTLVNLICRYCYELTLKNIKFITPNIEHPEKEIGIIRIIHKEYSTLIQKALKEIIKDSEQLLKSF